MGRPLYTNNAASALAFGINATQTTIQVQDGMGALFPTPSGGDYFYITVTSISVGNAYEIMQCTSRVGDVLTVIRGAEGTNAQFFNIGDNVQLRITAAGMTYAVNTGSTATNVQFTPYSFVTATNVQDAIDQTIDGVNASAKSSSLSAGNGSSLIGYNQGGFGASNQTVQSKLQQIISVKDFGAVGDGVTNDTTACQNAWNAVKALGGGVLYFPNGTYLCNIVGAGSDNVSIQGEGAGSIIRSYSSNAFAVKYDTGFPSAALFVNDVNFYDSTGAQTKHGLYVNTGTGLALNNVQFKGLGIGFCNNSTIQFKFDSCKFTNNYCCVFTTTSTGSDTSITNVNGQTVTITNAFYAQHPGILLFENCTFSGKIGHYFEQPDNPYNLETNIKYLNCTFAPTSGIGFYINNGGWTHNVSADSTWFEGTLSTVSLRSLTLPATYAYSSSTNLIFENLFINNVSIAGNCLCTLNNCSTNDGGSFLSTGRASYIFNNILADGLGGFTLPGYAEGVQNFTSNRPIVFLTSPKTNISRGFKTNLVYSNTCFSGDTLFGSFGGTITHSTTNSSFSTLQSFQVAVTAVNNGAYLNTSALTFDTTGIYVYTFTAQSLGSDFVAQIQSPIGSANVTIPAAGLQTFAIIGTAASATSSGTLLMLNEGSATQTWLVSGIQVLRFNSYSEAAKFLASDTFNIV